MNRWKIWLLAGLGLILVGCAQKLTYERWDTIQQGESPEVVKAILGKPLEQGDTRWLYHDADRGITADIYFQDAKVIGKTWADPDRGMCGKSPLVNQPGDVDKHEYRKVE